MCDLLCGHNVVPAGTIYEQHDDKGRLFVWTPDPLTGIYSVALGEPPEPDWTDPPWRRFDLGDGDASA